MGRQCHLELNITPADLLIVTIKLKYEKTKIIRVHKKINCVLNYVLFYLFEVNILP